MPLDLYRNNEREYIYEACLALCILSGAERPVPSDPIWMVKKKGLAAVTQITGGGIGTVTAVTASSPLISSGGSTPKISIPRATSSADGYLSSSDWTNFNSKQIAGSYITSLTGDVTASGPGSVVATLANTAVVPGSYTNASITVDSKGRITSASSGSGAGTVTSVGLSLPSFIVVSGSPVTTSGTLTGTLAPQSQRRFFAGPVSGLGVAPTFRTIQPSDIPALPYAPLALLSGHIFVGSAGNIATDTIMSGDATIVSTGVLTLANTAVVAASYGSSTSIPSFTVDSKGRLTAASGNAVIAPAGTLTGTTLAANVVSSSLTSVGTLTGGATGAGFTIALGASTVTGDLALSNFTQASAASRLLGRGSASGAGDYQEITLGTGITMTGTVLSATGSGGTVTSVSVVSANGFAGTVATATTTPAITVSTTITGVLKGNGTAISAAVAGTDYLTPAQVLSRVFCHC